MKFIFPQNFAFKNKILGVIDISTLFLNIFWDTFIYCLLNLFFSNINIIIHNEEKELLYDGPALGLEYKVDNVLVDDTIFIGYYEPYTKDNLKVRSTLKKDYDNTENINLSDVEWEFYAMADSSVEIINPDTQDVILRYIIIFVITLILFIIFIYYKKKKI